MKVPWVGIVLGGVRFMHQRPNSVRRFETADPTERMKSRIHPKYKTKYRVKNWASYDRALVRRGDITIW